MQQEKEALPINDNGSTAKGNYYDYNVLCDSIII